MMSPSFDERSAAFAELSAPTPEGKARRARLRAGIEHSAHEFHAIGIEMNQHYESSAIYMHDEVEPFEFSGQAVEDSVLYYDANTYPGSRLPHAWLSKAIPAKPISTIDLAGKGGWTLFTGIGGQGWKDAAVFVGKNLSVKIICVAIGFRQDWEDVYMDWERVRAVEEDGCVLARPDLFIAWRAISGGSENARLLKVMRSVLGLDGPKACN